MAQQMPSSTSSSPLAHFRDSLRYTLQDAAADPSSDSMPLETLNDQDDSPLGGSSFATALPRRNHTISGSARNKTKRLPQHFEQPSVKPNRGPVSPLAGSLPLSPNRNSLKEITGTENEHDEWEKAIKDEVSSRRRPEHRKDEETELTILPRNVRPALLGGRRSGLVALFELKFSFWIPRSNSSSTSSSVPQSSPSQSQPCRSIEQQASSRN